MSKPPPYVSYVALDAIHIESLDRVSAKRLREAGLAVSLGWLSFGQVPIEPPLPSGESSPDEEDKLMQLARLGVAFAADYKQGMDPVGMMLNLIERGRYVGTFKQIAFTGPGAFTLTVLPKFDRP